MKLWIVSISLVFSLQTVTSLGENCHTLQTTISLQSFNTEKFKAVCLPAAEIPPSLEPTKIQDFFYFSQLWNAYLKLCCIFRQLQNLLLQLVGVHAIPNNLNETQSV